MELENSRLITLFETLSKAEFRQLDKVLRSPFFNQKEDLIHLFDYLNQSLNYEGVLPSKQDIFKKLFPKEPFVAEKVRWLMSKLTKVIENFLAYQEYFSDPAMVKTKIAIAYRKRELEKHFHATIQEAEKILEKAPYQHGESFRNRYEIQLEKYNFTSKGARKSSENFYDITHNYDVFFLSTKLRQGCISLSLQNLSNTEQELGMIAETLQYVQKKGMLDIPAISVYYYCYYALAYLDQEDYFQQFKQLLFEHGVKFPIDEIQDLYLLAINYCIRRLNEGKKGFAQEGLELYKAGLESKVLLKEGTLSIFAYRNIIAMGLIVKEYEWVETFLYTYKSALDIKQRESIFKFNLARLEYTRKNYDKAIELLSQANYKDLLLSLSAKAMALKIYYELGEFRLLDSHLHSMKAYLVRKKVIGYHRTNYLNLIRYTQKLIGLNFYDKEAVEQLKKSIEEEKAISEREWLLQQF